MKRKKPPNPDVLTGDAAWLARPALPTAFFARSATEVAPDLLGKALVRVDRGRVRVGEIVEVEAYLGQADAASHTYRGPTRRNQSMFGPPGTCYVYLSYGINYCMNVVTGAVGQGEAVLIRALAPLHGLERMARARGLELTPAPRATALRQVAGGPGRLTAALGVDLRHDGLSLAGDVLRIVSFQADLAAACIGVSPRIGITKAADLPLRFFVKGSTCLSRREGQIMSR